MSFFEQIKAAADKAAAEISAASRLMACGGHDGDCGIPIVILAEEREAIYQCEAEELRGVVAREERTLDERQLSWQNET